MPGTKRVNSDLNILGKLSVSTIPNLGTVTPVILTQNQTTKEISSRTGSEFISDLGIARQLWVTNEFINKGVNILTTSEEFRIQFGNGGGLSNSGQNLLLFNGPSTFYLDDDNNTYLTNSNLTVEGGIFGQIGNFWGGEFGNLRMQEGGDVRFDPSPIGVKGGVGWYNNTTTEVSKYYIYDNNYGNTLGLQVDGTTTYPLIHSGNVTTYVNPLLGNFVTLNTTQEITGLKTFITTGNSYTDKKLQVKGNGSTLFPGIAFHQPGIIANQILMTNDGSFNFVNGANSDYAGLRVKELETYGSIINKIGIFKSDSIIGFYTEGGGAQSIKTGGLLASDTYGDTAPLYGLRTKGKNFLNAPSGMGDPTISLAIGDTDTGFNWENDGFIDYYSNGQKLYSLNDIPQMSWYNTKGKRLFKNSNNSVESEWLLTTNFGNIANQAVDIEFSSGTTYWGFLEVEVTSYFAVFNAPGLIKKILVLGHGNDGTTIYKQGSRIQEAIGGTPLTINISDIYSKNGKWVITLSNLTDAANDFAIKLRWISPDNIDANTQYFSMGLTYTNTNFRNTQYVNYDKLKVPYINLAETYSDTAHYIKHFADDSDGFGISNSFKVKAYNNESIDYFVASANGYMYNKFGLHSLSFTTGNQQVLNYSNPSTLYVGNPTIDTTYEANVLGHRFTSGDYSKAMFFNASNGLTIVSPDSIRGSIGSAGLYSKLRLSSHGSYGMNFWVETSGQGFIQQQRFDGQEVPYELHLQPLGSTVQIARHQDDNNNVKLAVYGGSINYGKEGNYVWTFTKQDVNEIASGHEYRWYDTYWKIGNARGGNIDSRGFSVTYNDVEQAIVLTDSNIVTRQYGSAHLWNQAYQWGNHAGKYLPLSGGVLTGGAKIESVGSIILQQVPTDNATGLFWEKMDDSERMAGIGAYTIGDVVNYLYMGWNVGDPWNPVNAFIVSNNFIKYKNQTVWHAGNDGAGSGLDADLLDGKQGNQFINLEINHLTQGNNVDYNEIVYPINQNVWYIQPYHGGNYTGQLNAPPIGGYGTLITMSGTDTAFYHQLAIGNGGELAIRSAYNSNKFTSSWVRYWSTNNFNDSDINRWNDAVTKSNDQTISGVKTFTGTINAGSFKKTGGTSTQILMADGSVKEQSTVGGSNYTAGSNITIAGNAISVVNSPTFSGSVTATAFYESSLRELKENIQPFEKSGLELVNELDVVTFDRKDGSVKNKIGIIADDSPEEFLSEDKDTVDLYKTIFIQAKAIQELTKRIEELENKIK